MKNPLQKKVPALVAAVLAVSMAGCASQQQNHEHPELMARIQAAERAAAEAQAAAARAQARADEAAAMAQANGDKVDRAFSKSQRK